MIRLQFDDETRKQLPSLLWMILSVLPIMLLQIGGETVGHTLEFNRELIARGEVWRIYTGNWVHFGWQHTLMNFVGMAIIALLVFWQRHDRYWWWAMAIIPVCTGLGLYYDSPLSIYRGYSGAAYGILIVGFILEWRYNRLVMTVAIGVLLGKIVQEQAPDYDINYLKDQIGVSVAVKAHFWGVMSGIVLGAIILIKQLLTNTSSVNPVEDGESRTKQNKSAD